MGQLGSSWFFHFLVFPNIKLFTSLKRVWNESFFQPLCFQLEGQVWCVPGAQTGRAARTKCHKLDFQVGSGEPALVLTALLQTQSNQHPVQDSSVRQRSPGIPQAAGCRGDKAEALPMPAHRPWCHGQGSACGLLLPVLDTNPIPSLRLLLPCASPLLIPSSLCCALASLLCPQEGPRGHPAMWHLPFPLSPSSHPAGCPGSVLATFDRGVTTVRTSSTLRFHGWEQVGRGEAPAGGVCSPPAHLDPQLPSGLGSKRGVSSLQRKIFLGGRE